MADQRYVLYRDQERNLIALAWPPARVQPQWLPLLAGRPMSAPVARRVLKLYGASERLPTDRSRLDED